MIGELGGGPKRRILEPSGDYQDLLTPRLNGTPLVDRDARILTYDIERLPAIARVWEPRTRYISPRQFIQWPTILSYAGRWYGHKRPIFDATWKHDSDDRRGVELDLAVGLWKLLDEADIVVGYNSVKFDNKHLRSLWLEAGMPPPRPWKDVDLYKVVQQFGFESKSLDSVTRRLGRPGKPLHYDIDTAVSAAEGNRAAQKTMRFYNIADVELTEWLYDRLRGWMPTHPHPGNFGDQLRCNQCGGDDLELQPTKYRAVRLDYALYRCQACRSNLRGAWHSTRVSSTAGVK